MERGSEMEEVKVVIVGAGPSGLATSACLTKFSISHVILEREDCCASLWKKRSYDRMKLHLAKEYCHLPHMPFPSNAPTYVPKEGFIRYIDNYVSEFDLSPKYCRSVEAASYDGLTKKWRIQAKNKVSSQMEVYTSEFLVVASGENSEAFTPSFPGLESFLGKTIHSSRYKSGSGYKNSDVLIVGSGNSGMEIAWDLLNNGARPSIVIRSPVHVVPKGMVRLAMKLLAYLPLGWVDALTMKVVNFWYGDLSKHGILKPAQGPFYIKATTGRSPVVDVGTVAKIKQGKIKVLPPVSSINNDTVVFENGSTRRFDAIIFATGYRSTANHWLKDYDSLLDNDGMPKKRFPNHWKGSDGLYCVGLSRRGLSGVNWDAQAISNDIKSVLRNK